MAKGNSINDGGLKSCIFAEVDILLITLMSFPQYYDIN